MKRIILGFSTIVTCSMAGALYWAALPGSQEAIIQQDANSSIREAHSPTQAGALMNSSMVSQYLAAGDMPTIDAKTLGLDDPADGTTAGTIDDYINRLAIKLLEAYGATIQSPRVQAQLLQVRNQVIIAYPLQGGEIFIRVIQAAFPDRVNEILAVVASMESYQNWLDNNHLALSEMGILERQGALWHKRHQLFGEAAEVIWVEEKQVWAQKQQTIQKVILDLDQAQQSSLDETLFQLQTALNETYGNGIDQLALDQGIVAQVYFGFESVQSKLRTMSPEARQGEINQLRQQLGYSEEQIQRLQVRDEKRNARWDNGMSYMAERQALTTRLSGPELERQLAQLREQYFKHEARTIALEEQDGFFRYERPRLYGRN